MAEQKERIEQKDKTIALNVRLRPVENADQPLSANYTTVGLAQGIAYLDFGFIEPALMAAVVRSAQNGGNVPKNLEGKLAARVGMSLVGILRLHQQLQQVLVGLRGKREVKQ